ncbi:Meiotic chromosome segregation protein [Colletotrichum chlorophyti]|uniref:Meiotic chromosome segregation protein n=1 Tax=Colletotrichum chlorophyti TaxID=708187 RepID=A0A1Q8RVN6_9PEZI|nr:Meiotic chromosome segregation protein [Colletotrichum chlorophyti]
MNNDQFRRLLGANSDKAASKSNGPSPSSSSPASSGALGSRQRSSIPMTPRSLGVGGGRAEFARQLAARNQAANPQKKVRSSAPKGSRLAEGYVDRSKERAEEEEDDRARRIKALEESLKNEEIDQATFEKLRSEIAGGDLSSTHLIKGLDFKLLQRIRRGEDVYGDKEDNDEEAQPQEDVDEAFDEIAGAEVKAVEKEQVQKKGQFAPVTLAPGKKRTRDQILAEMKAARAAAKAQQDAGLGDKFRKIGAKQKPGSRIERDSKGREVLIIIDEDGHEKRKVRKTQPQTEEEQRKEFMPDKDAKPLGMEVPEIYRKKQEEPEEDDNDDIFADAGDDYDPLAGMDDSSDDDSEGEVKETAANTDDVELTTSTDAKLMPPPPPPKPVQPRNYFKDSKTELISSQTLKGPSMSDPAIQAAFKRAAQLKAANKTEEDEDEEVDEEARARAARHKKMLQAADRDAEDLDMGFGTSRFEDEADFDDQPIKLSEWGREDNGDGPGGSKNKRKRGPKKRKGDANNAADVLRVMEQRKAAKP